MEPSGDHPVILTLRYQVLANADTLAHQFRSKQGNLSSQEIADMIETLIKSPVRVCIARLSKPITEPPT